VQPYIILFSFIVFNKFNVCIGLYYKFILINKFIKQNWVNYLCCDIKYFDLHLSLSVFSFVFFIVDYFSLFIYTMIIDLLVRCVHKFFDLHLGFCLCKKTSWKIMHARFFIMFWCFRFDLYYYYLWYFPSTLLCSIHDFFVCFSGHYPDKCATSFN